MQPWFWPQSGESPIRKQFDVSYATSFSATTTSTAHLCRAFAEKQKRTPPPESSCWGCSTWCAGPCCGAGPPGHGWTGRAPAPPQGRNGPASRTWARGPLALSLHSFLFFVCVCRKCECNMVCSGVRCTKLILLTCSVFVCWLLGFLVRNLSWNA